LVIAVASCGCDPCGIWPSIWLSIASSWFCMLIALGRICASISWSIPCTCAMNWEIIVASWPY
jgi:hypothetical protein